MRTQRNMWPDIDGAPVGLGDWVQVFCSWTRQPKFEGRAVQVVDVLRGGSGEVFCLRDPLMQAGRYFLVADGHGYRRVCDPQTMN